LTGLWSKVSETFAAEEDGDVDVYALYGSYTGLEDLVIDGYVAFLRSAAGFAQGNEETVELTTVGARVAGERGAFDFEGELAYQTGQAMVAIGVSGASDIDYDALGANVEIGFTFDNDKQTRIFLGAAFFEGTDGDDVGFNRMFSDWEYSEFLGNTDLSNVMIIRGGVGTQWTEKISTSSVLSWFQVDEETGSSDDTLGIELGTAITYDYSEDLYFELGWASFFVDDGIEDGNLIGGNGMFLVGGNGDDEDAQYIYLETGIDF
jgi:hypothetical protein